MPWVRFWVRSNCASGHNEEESVYEYFDRPLNVTVDGGWLQDTAEEHVPDWMRHTERGCRYGYEILSFLPSAVRYRMIDKYRDQIEHAEKMLDVLFDRTPSRAKSSRPTAWEHIKAEKEP